MCDEEIDLDEICKFPIFVYAKGSAYPSNQANYPSATAACMKQINYKQHQQIITFLCRFVVCSSDPAGGAAAGVAYPSTNGAAGIAYPSTNGAAAGNAYPSTAAPYPSAQAPIDGNSAAIQACKRTLSFSMK